MADGTGTGFGGTGQSTTAANPYGLTPSMQAWMQGLSGLSNTLNQQSTGGANFMRPNPGMAWSQGTPNNLLETILQMRQAQAQGLGAPYQYGVAMPRVSLLSG